MDWLVMDRWSPYVAGAGIGVLSCLAFVFSNRPLGCSTSYATTCGILARLAGSRKAEEHPYIQQVGTRIDWQWMLLLGVVIGSALSALASGTAAVQWVPSRWASAFGDSASWRLVAAVAGGILMGFGARWAGGCTSGHGISGGLQLALSGWAAIMAFFAGGITTAMFLFHVLGS